MRHSSAKNTLIGGALWLAVLGFSHIPAALADDDLDTLLRQADSALSGGKAEPSPEAHGDTVAPAGSKKARRRKSRTTDAEANESQVQVPAAPAVPSSGTHEPASLRAVDDKGVSSILALDLQERERERIAQGRQVSAELGFGADYLPPVYQVLKDDDTFSIKHAVVLTGFRADLGTSWWLTDGALEAFGGGVRPSLGISGGFGYFQGDVDVSRSGVQNYNAVYAYQLLPIDAGVMASLTSTSGWRGWVTLGGGGDIVRQVGTGQTDTFTAFFVGETALIGVAKHFASGFDVQLQAQDRGLTLLQKNVKTSTNRIAGRTMTLGMGMPVSG